MLPYLSVILPVRNERELVPGLIDQLLKQNYPPELFEILVVDGASTDGTGDLVARRYGQRNVRVRVRVIHNPKKTAAAGRNLGVRAAAGDAFIFLSPRCVIPSENLLADTAALLETVPEAACFCQPRPLTGPAGTKTGEAIAHAWASPLGRRPEWPAKAGFVDTPDGAAIYRRRVFEKVGVFDEGFCACEDEDFNLRAWKSVIQAYSDPRLAVHERPHNTLRSFFAEMIRRGRGTSRLMRKHPRQARLAQIAPLTTLLALLVGLFAWSQLPRPAALSVTLPLVVFPLALLIASVQLGTRYGFRTAWKAPWIFAAIYCGQAIGLFREYAFPRAEPAESSAAPALEQTPLVERLERLLQRDRAA
jgi:succinoglycan biosynthesis protein ExoA